MLKFIAKITLCLALLRTIGFGDVFVDSSEPPLDVKRVDLIAALDLYNDSSQETDCTDESCADHKCHFSHCPVHFPEIQKVDLPTPAILRSAFFYQGLVLNEFSSKLIKPPSV